MSISSTVTTPSVKAMENEIGNAMREFFYHYEKHIKPFASEGKSLPVSNCGYCQKLMEVVGQ